MKRLFLDRSANQPLVLLVEPMADIRNKVAAALKRTNLRLLAAENGKAALNIAQRIEQPTLAVIELALSDMKGVEVARMLYRQHPLPIIMTGYQPDPLTIAIMLDQVAEDFVQKPFDERELVVRMLRLLPGNHPMISDANAPSLGTFQPMNRAAEPSRAARIE